MPVTARYNPLPVFHLNPVGNRHTIFETPANYQQYVIGHCREMVREAGYNMVRLRAVGDLGECYSRAFSLYHMACDMLRDFDSEAEDFISRTWNPKDH